MYVCTKQPLLLDNNKYTQINLRSKYLHRIVSDSLRRSIPVRRSEVIQTGSVVALSETFKELQDDAIDAEVIRAESDMGVVRHVQHGRHAAEPTLKPIPQAIFGVRIVSAH